jgi:hypothetical protein
MKYFLIAAICFLRINSFCYAQNTQSVLWEISGNGLAKKSYLFGTIHTAKTDIYYSFPKLNSIIKKCDIGLFEMSGKPINGVNKKNNDTSNIQPPPLGKVFTAREFAIVDSFFTRSPFGSIQPTDSLPLFAVLQLATLVKQTGGKQETLFDGFLCTQMEMLKNQRSHLTIPMTHQYEPLLAILLVWLNN